MQQATFSVRMDANLKKQFDCLCQDFGMNTSTAINIFARAVVKQRKIPFEISALNNPSDNALNTFNALQTQAKNNGVSDLSLDEINKEIKRCRLEI
ncbi:MAG: type II toxin-antitoxin system RelB/DinJ family antitoxin [Neisseriaceae bacterium]|nr:type II toxin-antitoxin system RelB/DinJ family antitoxin [Neisseriaceae bacterium]